VASRRTLPVVPEHLDQPAAPTAEHKKVPVVRIALERLLHHGAKASEFPTFVVLTSCDSVRELHQSPAQRRVFNLGRGCDNSCSILKGAPNHPNRCLARRWSGSSWTEIARTIISVRSRIRPKLRLLSQLGHLQVAGRATTFGGICPGHAEKKH
jgi:hypothetical protein